MNPVITGTANIGMLFGTINMLLIPYLTTVYGSSEIPGHLLSVGLLISLFTGVFVGTMSDRIGRRMPFIVLLTSTGCLSLVGLGFLPDALAGLFAVLLMVSTYSIQPSQSAIVGDYSNQSNRDKNYGISAGLINLSSFMISLVIGGLYAHGRGTLFAVLGLMVVLPVVPAFLYERKRPIFFAPATGGTEKANLLSFLKRYPLLLIFFAGLYGIWFALGAFYPYLTSFLSTETSMDLGDAAIWMGALNIIIGVISFTTGAASRKFGQERLLKLSLMTLITISGLIFAFYRYLLPSETTITMWLTFYILGGSSIGFVYSLSMSILSSLVSGNDQGRAFGLNNIFIILAQSTSVAILGSLLEKGGYKWLFAIIAAGFSIALVSFSVLFHLSRRDIVAEPLNLVEEKG